MRNILAVSVAVLTVAASIMFLGFASYSSYLNTVDEINCASCMPQVDLQMATFRFSLGTAILGVGIILLVLDYKQARAKHLPV
jgi:uncharacterized membrane protein